ncbi:MAG: hypothetical protein N5P05_000876 [Chroococcopsis gigantea SAG 12.99]|jgi:cadmium resistance transport/sequestration family protein|nr:cadmium resistance transporter [Chlorogloea purpurea SAG 13.99]MDV2999270.1 hypothetical protein [Chroococcopsis gigantea SAG 12.99]
MELVSVLTTAISSFVATNVDDIIILMLFFSQINSGFRPRHIIIGQYLGFTLLILASLPGLLGGMMIPKTWLGLLGFLPIIIGIQQIMNGDDEGEVQTVSDGITPRESQSRWRKIFSSIPPQTYHVASVTVANGGDNIGVYVPLFASTQGAGIAVILAVFYVMVGIWCFGAYWLTRHPRIAYVLTKYGDRIAPWVLIIIGLHILIDSESYRLLEFYF